MKIFIDKSDLYTETEISIKCNSLDQELIDLVYKITNQNQNQNLKVIKDGTTYIIEYKNIYYFESVDNKVFVYTEKETFETSYKLYELEELLKNNNFFRNNKSFIVNIDKIKSFKSMINSRILITMKNGENLIVSRNNIIDLKRKLGIL